MLPTRFDESLERAFQANSEQTAQRILRAHDAFNRIAPVTTQSVKNYMRLETATDRAHILADILAMDLNGDAVITRAEFDVLRGLPNGYKNQHGWAISLDMMTTEMAIFRLAKPLPLQSIWPPIALK